MKPLKNALQCSPQVHELDWLSQTLATGAWSPRSPSPKSPSACKAEDGSESMEQTLQCRSRTPTPLAGESGEGDSNLFPF